VALKPALAAVAQIEPAQEEAAALDGATLAQRLRYVIAPAVLPAAVAGGTLVFLIAFNELTVSALLWSTGPRRSGCASSASRSGAREPGRRHCGDYGRDHHHHHAGARPAGAAFAGGCAPLAALRYPAIGGFDFGGTYANKTQSTQQGIGGSAMRMIGHFIGGREVQGGSGRLADVFQPMTGDVIAQVALASTAELRAAVENAKAAQVAWGATNPQRRARVMMKFLDLIAKEIEPLADLLAREHGKTIPDAKGDIQRGVEVAEFACGIPHLMKGEYTEGAGPGIDIYSMRQPLGVVAGITPFNFPAMIPMWKFAPAIACGNAFILKPSERDPGVPMRLAELMIEAGPAPGILNVVNGDKEAVTPSWTIRHPRGRLRGLVRRSPVRLFARRRHGRAGAVLRRRQEPHDHHARRRHRPGRSTRWWGGLRLGGRALHGDLGGGAGGQGHGRRPDEQARTPGRKPQDRPLHRPVRRSRAPRHQGPHGEGASYVDIGVRKARSSWSTVATSGCRATRTAFTWAAVCSTR
jgi:hypothetical protein